MGAGSFAAGYGLAGLDPIQGGGPPQVTQAPPVALAYSPGTSATAGGTYLANPDGTMVSVTVAEAAAGLALGIPYGSIPSAPTVGQKLRRVLSRVAPQNKATIALQEVRRVLAPLIASGQIALLNVVVDTSRSAQGTDLVAVTTQDLTVAGRKPLTTSI